MTRKPYEQGRIFAGRVPNGADLLAAITRIANEEAIKVGSVMIYGLLAQATLSAFNQHTRTTHTRTLDGGVEIASLSGTISQFKGRSMARLSGTFILSDGGLVGGSIAVGSIAHACEVIITELKGGVLSRDFDPETGLPLWKGALLV